MNWHVVDPTNSAPKERPHIPREYATWVADDKGAMTEVKYIAPESDAA